MESIMHNRMLHRWDQHQAYNNQANNANGPVPLSEEQKQEFETRFGVMNENYKEWKKTSSRTNQSDYFAAIPYNPSCREAEFRFYGSERGTGSERSSFQETNKYLSIILVLIIIEVGEKDGGEREKI